MPRAKPSPPDDGGVLVPLDKVVLSDEQLETLAAHAGLRGGSSRALPPFRDDVLRAVAYYLGCREHAAARLEAGEDGPMSSPSPAAHRAGLQQLALPLEALGRWLDSSNSELRDRLTLAGANLMQLGFEVAAAARAVGIVDHVLENDDEESRGRPRDDARDEALELLALAFQRHERGPADDYAERLSEFLIEGSKLGEIPMPTDGRVLDLIEGVLKVPRNAPL